MAVVLIRKVPDELWAKAKAKAQREGRWIRTVLIELLAQWVDQK